MAGFTHSRGGLLFLLASIGLTLALYLPNLPTEYVGGDRTTYVKPLNSHDYLQMTRALFIDYRGEVVLGYYAPIASVSLMLDKAIFGSKRPFPKGTHLINLILHCINGILVWAVVRSIGGVWTACFTALFFLIHPMQVSSISWFAQRKVLLAMLFFLSSFSFYLEYRKKQSALFLVLSLVAFTASLFSKPQAIAAPFLFVATELLGFAGPRKIRTIPSKGTKGPANEFEYGSTSPSSNSEPRRGRRLLETIKTLLPTFPFFLIAIGFGIFTLFIKSSNSTQPVELLHQPFIAAAATFFLFCKSDAASQPYVYCIRNGMCGLPLSFGGSH